jgi:hypothetical protein
VSDADRNLTDGDVKALADALSGTRRKSAGEKANSTIRSLKRSLTKQKIHVHVDKLAEDVSTATARAREEREEEPLFKRNDEAEAKNPMLKGLRERGESRHLDEAQVAEARAQAEEKGLDPDAAEARVRRYADQPPPDWLRQAIRQPEGP